MEEETEKLKVEIEEERKVNSEMMTKLTEAEQNVVEISEKCQHYEHKSAETLKELDEQKQNIDSLEATVDTYKCKVEEVTKQKNEAEVMMTKLQVRVAKSVVFGFFGDSF